MTGPSEQIVKGLSRAPLVARWPAEYSSLMSVARLELHCRWGSVGVHASKFRSPTGFVCKPLVTHTLPRHSPKSNRDLQYPFPAYRTFPTLQVHGSKELGGTSTAVSPALVHGKAYGVTTATVRLNPL